MKTLKTAGATVNQTPFDWNNNTQHILDAIGEARRQHVQLLCFPEMCVTGYGCEDMFLSEWLPEKAWEQVNHIRTFTDHITICIGIPLRVGNITYNGVCVIRNREILGITLKQYLANDGVHYEPRWFQPWQPGEVITITRGDETIQAGDLIYTIEGVRVGFEICEDAWRKTLRPGYRLLQRGVELIVNPSASHFAMGKSELREREVVLDGTVLFDCAYLFVNLLGNEAGRMIYDGDIIIAQKNKLLAVNERFSFAPFNLLCTTINFDDPASSVVVASTDVKVRNEELTRAVSLGLFDYLRKSKAKGFVLSLSGGADSSACAIMVSEMVKRAGRARGWAAFSDAMGITPVTNEADAMHAMLTCAYQGTKNSSEQTLHAAQSLAAAIGAGFHQWEIDDEVSAYTTKIEHAIGRKLTWQDDDITLQNIQARTRSPIIWMLANTRRAVLLTTSNRSEGDVGYATMDGDTSGSFAPIAGLSKTFILQWLRWAETALSQRGLYAVNHLQPTAELRPLERNQTDEEDLMPYVVLEAIERLAILERRSPAAVFAAMKGNGDDEVLKGYIRKFFRLWTANQWKRERLAPSFHLDELNVDPRTWCRFPILSSGFAEELAAL